MVAFVIIARKVQHAMQRQNFDLLSDTVPKPPRVLGSDLGRDGDLARQAVRRNGRKRKHIGRLVLSAKTPVQGLQFAAAGHQHIDLTPQTGCTPGAQEKSRKSRLV